MSRWRRFLLPLTLLIVGFGVTLAATLSALAADQERNEARFALLSQTVARSLGQRLEEQILLLKGVAALFTANETVRVTDFSAYVRRLDLDGSHPGVLGIGFAIALDRPDDVPSVLATASEKGLGVIRLWPEARRYPASAILFLEPRIAVNRRAIGFDMMSEPVRREALERARATGQPALSGRVQLVQDAQRRSEPGFLLYVPVDRPGPTGRDGWAYSPLRVRDLFGSALARTDLGGARVMVYDTVAAPDRLLFDNAFATRAGAPMLDRRIDVAGRALIVRVIATPAFDEGSAGAALSLAPLVGVAGTLLTLLLTLLAWQQARGSARTALKVEAATRSLRAANAQLVAAAAARDEAETRLRQSQKMEALGQLTGGIAHDFNNMLAVVIGNLELAEKRLGDPARVARALGLARDGAARAAELTRRLLAFGRQQPLAPTIIDANALIADMRVLLTRAVGETITLTITPADDLWPLEADVSQLENAILNLAVNARDAMPDGGALTIATQNCQRTGVPGDGRGDTAAVGDYVRVIVTDTGTGMDADTQARALDPFFTTKPVGKGTGLGLSQVFGFVRQTGGDLAIHSAPGAGTSIIIDLPRASAAAIAAAGARDEAAGVEEAVPRGSPRELVIVAEDEDGVRDTTVDALRDLGYSVVHARDGDEALRALATHGGAALLLTDVIMPGMNGRELAEAATARHPGLPVLYTTGYARDAIVRDGRLHSGVTLLAKPYRLSDLARQVRAAIDAGRRGSAATTPPPAPSATRDDPAR